MGINKEFDMKVTKKDVDAIISDSHTEYPLLRGKAIKDFSGCWECGRYSPENTNWINYIYAVAISGQVVPVVVRLGIIV